MYLQAVKSRQATEQFLSEERRETEEKVLNRSYSLRIWPAYLVLVKSPYVQTLGQIILLKKFRGFAKLKSNHFT